MIRQFLTSLGVATVAATILSPAAAAQDLDRWSPKPEGQKQTRDPLAKNGCVGCVPKAAKPAKTWTLIFVAFRVFVMITSSELERQSASL
jgi:hypothetical protein